MSFIKANKVSIFRKVALSTWNSGGDPSVYGFLEIDITNSTSKSSPLPSVIKALASIMVKHKELNSVLKFGKLHYRKNVNISVIVNIPESGRQDLSFATLNDVDKMTIQDIEGALYKKSSLIREKKDPHLGFALKLIHILPAWMTKYFVWLFSFLTHDLNLNLEAFRLPRNPFGSVMVSNVGSLGIKNALVPLVPFTRSVLMMSVGQITREPRVVEDRIEIRQIMHLGITFDHRFFDGSHAARMIRDFEEYFLFTSGTA